jgi:multidrug/hemolysin transport system permease protein
MNTLTILIKRNTKMFFKDKGLLFTSLITPLILLVLYATFLSNVYKDSFMMSIPETLQVDEKLINACVGGQLLSSLLAVCCVTVAFCSNMLMIQDKVTGTRKDLLITPVSSSILALSYYIATIFVTLLICFIAIGGGMIYLACIGWYLRFTDILLILLDVFILVLFGTSLSSIVNCFLSSQGQISAVGSIVSAGYGFICGAYMPISSFGDGLQKVVFAWNVRNVVT